MGRRGVGWGGKGWRRPATPATATKRTTTTKRPTTTKCPGLNKKVIASFPFPVEVEDCNGNAKVRTTTPHLTVYDTTKKPTTQRPGEAGRPPVRDIEASYFLKSLLFYSPDYLEKLFGPKARNHLQDMGGVDKVASALSESQTIEDFARELQLQKADVDHLRGVLVAVEDGDDGELKSLGIKDSELANVKNFLEKLVNTGFLGEAGRSPVRDIEASGFLKSLLTSYGSNYLEKIFGTKKARNRLHDLGGVDKVAIALSYSQTIEDFGRELGLQSADVEHFRGVLVAVENGDDGTLKGFGIKDSELANVKLFLEKLVNTGFLD